MRKNAQNLGETGPPVPVFISMAIDQRSGPSGLAGTDPSNSDTATAVCMCSRGRVRTRVRACVMRLQYTIIIFDPG